MAHDCSDTPRSRARFATSALMSRTRLRLPSIPRCEHRAGHDPYVSEAGLRPYQATKELRRHLESSRQPGCLLAALH